MSATTQIYIAGLICGAAAITLFFWLNGNLQFAPTL